MSKPRRRKEPRKTEVKGNRTSTYWPDDTLPRANQIFDYAYKRGISGSFLMRSLLEAWMQNEEESLNKRR